MQGMVWVSGGYLKWSGTSVMNVVSAIYTWLPACLHAWLLDLVEGRQPGRLAGGVALAPGKVTHHVAPLQASCLV